MGGSLADLFLPLRFAARDDFAGAAKLRGLARLVEHHLPRERASGADEIRLGALADAARRFDEAAAVDRPAAIREVILALGRLSTLPPDLEKLVGTSQAEATPPPSGTPASTPPRRPRPASARAAAAPEKLRLESPPAGKPAAKKPTAKRALTKPAPRADTESTAASKILVPAFARARLERKVSDLHGVGPKFAEQLAKKGITTVGHVLFFLPRGYQDRRNVASIRELQPGQKGLTSGEVAEISEVFNPRSRKRMLRVVLRDETGRLALTFFHYWPSTVKRFEKGKRFFAWGDVKLFGGTRQIVHPELEEIHEGESSSGMGRIVPVYRGMDELGQGRYRSLAQRVLADHLSDLPEILPDTLRSARQLPTLREALAAVHLPGNDADVATLSACLSPGHMRLAYEELLLLSMGLALKARGVRTEPGHAFGIDEAALQKALRLLPFEPTGAQLRAIEAIAADMRRPEPMNRLIQGDVGSGKTAVALVAALLAIFDGKQAALMAPTELLAEQHHANFQRLLQGTGIEVALLAAGRGGKLLSQERRKVAAGEARLAVGTHALVSEGSAFGDLGLVIVDEQHRFGVEQRAELIAKGRRPDVLVMTATPIPRTLSLVLHGEMTQTIIDELPPGRTPVKTKVFSSKQREKIYEILDAQLQEGRQAYVVYPLIEESEKSDLEDATRGLATLQARFPSRRLALLHGRMKPEERDEVMARFRRAEIDLLVATTVVEVGVDVPNASVMVIEHAERFGLSQLHQLRGRVGRGAAKSYCFLVDHAGREGRARERLAIMEKTTDGFRIAQADLEIRGPGEFLGTKQAGLPELQFAELSRDARLLEQARKDAFALVEADPTLRSHPLLRAEVFERFAERMSLARVG